MAEEVLADDIDCIVLGEGAIEFLVRLFKKNYDVFQVNQWGGITQITKVVSTENLWLHFNFWVVNEDTVDLALQAIKGEFYLGVVTYYAEDLESFDNARELYDKYFQDSVVPSTDIASNNRGMIPYQVFNEDLYIFNTQANIETQENFGAGLLAALCSDKEATGALNPQMAEQTKDVKFITSSVEPPFVAEKTGIFLWMFENYRRKNRRLSVSDALLKELKDALETVHTDSCTIL